MSIIYSRSSTEGSDHFAIYRTLVVHSVGFEYLIW